jgi:hypothetical protein
MPASHVWSIVEGPLLSFSLGVVLATVGLLLLAEYRRLFMSDPRGVMSLEVLMAIVNKQGAPGYVAAFLLSGAIISFALAIATLTLNALSYFTGAL